MNGFFTCMKRLRETIHSVYFMDTCLGDDCVGDGDGDDDGIFVTL